MFYYLDKDKKVQQVKGNFLTHIIENGNNSRIVGRTEAILGVHVSTVFLGSNVGIYDESPKYFETMITSERTEVLYRDVVERYATWDDALAGHAKWCNEVVAIVLSENTND